MKSYHLACHSMVGGLKDGSTGVDLLGIKEDLPCYMIREQFWANKKNGVCISMQNLATHKDTCGCACMLTHQPKRKNSPCPL